jgi:hypothetical protein
VEHHDQLPDPEVLGWVVVDCLLKVGEKSKDLAVMSNPGWWFGGDTLVGWSLSWTGASSVCLGRSSRSLQLLDDITCNILVEFEGPLSHMTATLNAKDLSLVIAGLLRVVELMSRKERHLKA